MPCYTASKSTVLHCHVVVNSVTFCYPVFYDMYTAILYMLCYIIVYVAILHSMVLHYISQLRALHYTTLDNMYHIIFYPFVPCYVIAYDIVCYVIAYDIIFHYVMLDYVFRYIVSSCIALQYVLLR